MKHCQRIVLALSLLCFAPMTTTAGIGYIGIYSDLQGYNCDFAPPLGPYNVYVIHKLNPSDEAYGSRFKLTVPTNWQFLSFSTPWVSIGVPTTDLSVGYGECLTTQTVIGTALYLVLAGGQSCGRVSVDPPDGFPSIVVADCSAQEVQGWGTSGVVNPDVNCCCLCLATEQSTWGSVKALYR